MKTLSRQTIHSIIGILFVVSGALGLIYQIVWFKYLSLFLGNTTYAQTIVLATFMGGLAIGSAWWGRKVDHAEHPLRLYAFLELGIGVYCLLYPKFLEVLKSIFISIVVSLQLPSDGTAVLLLKFLTSLCSLLVPTILMGGTLPILVRFISRKLEESGRNIAVLYFLNSLGAVFGSLLAGFFFIRILGLSTTVYFAAVVNFLIGGIAIVLSVVKTEQEKNNSKESEEPEIIFPRRDVIFAIVVAGISGLAAMIYEVTWVRLLIPVLGSSTYSFSLMLVTFISGITIGSFIVSLLIQRVKNLSAMLMWCQVGIVLSMLATIPMYVRIPYEFWKVASFLTRSDATYPIFLAIQFFFCFVLMIMPTIFLGMSLPVATRIASRGIHVLGKSVGNIFAVNTLGTVIGSLLAGLVLIPLIGVRHAIEVGIACNLLAALLVLLFTGSVPRRQTFIALSIVVCAVISYSIFVPTWNSGAMLSGVFRRIHSNAQLPMRYADFIDKENMTKVLFYKEGTTATIGVVEGGVGSEKQKILIVNGKADASSKGDLPTQVLLGQLPCFIHQDPLNALVIGLGSGITLGSVLTHPVKRVDCVEISPEVVEASSHFKEVNHNPLSDPRTTLFIEDALAYLKLTPRKYDIIISEPSNPWIAGIGNLYTTDFFEECKRRMNTGGLMVQWFHLYEMNDDLFKLVVRTFQSSFKYVSIWQPLDVDVIMIGSNQPITMTFERIQTAISLKGVKEDLQQIQLQDAATLLSLEMLPPESVVRYIGIGDLNTEDHPRLEYGAPGTFFLGTTVVQLAQYDERTRCDGMEIQLKKRMENKLLTDEELRNIGFFHTERQNSFSRFGYAVLSDLQKKYQNDVPLLKRLAKTAELLNLSREALSYYKKLAELESTNPDVLEKYAWLKYMIERDRTTILTPIDTKESEDLLYKSINLATDTVDSYRLSLADLYYGTQRYVKAADQYARTIQIRDKYERNLNIRDDAVFLRLARCLNWMGKNDRAIDYALQAVMINPKNEEAKDLVYELWTKKINEVKPN
ncbi:MAG: fused MFS/spermidine synthase [Ignavibacteriales bacterium]|nr:fused MFS/spermidine synthase [Ignavibacteriales bacterium]